MESSLFGFGRLPRGLQEVLAKVEKEAVIGIAIQRHPAIREDPEHVYDLVNYMGATAMGRFYDVSDPSIAILGDFILSFAQAHQLGPEDIAEAVRGSQEVDQEQMTKEAKERSRRIETMLYAGGSNLN